MPIKFPDSIKKRIILSTSLFCAGFLVAGIYIAATVQAGTSHLNHLIKMHQVGILREQLLFDMKTVQADIKARNTRFFKGAEGTIQDVLRMEDAGDRCLGCHHPEPVQSRIVGLVAQVRQYEASISRVLTMRANAERLDREEDVAYEEGGRLLDQMYHLISQANGSLQRRTAETLASVRRSNLVLFVLVALGPILAMFLGWQYLREFGRPVDVLLEATRKLRGGDLDHRICGLRHEFREVGDSFNAMAQSLQEQMHSMQRAERLAICGEVAAGLAHEVKNPLAGVKISLQVLGEELGLTGDLQDICVRATGEIDRIDSLVKGLLNFARPKSPKLRPTDVNEVLRKATEFTRQYKPRASGNAPRVDVAVELGVAMPPVLADPDQLQQAFLNIVLNGVEAMPEGGTLTVRSSASDGAVTIEFLDTGGGLPPEADGKIFEPFYTRKSGGTGLGLAITKRLIECQGGTIDAGNRPAGGARFTVTLPHGPAPEGAAP